MKHIFPLAYSVVLSCSLAQGCGNAPVHDGPARSDGIRTQHPQHADAAVDLDAAQTPQGSSDGAVNLGDASIPQGDAGLPSPSCVPNPQVQGALHAQWALSLGHGEAGSMVLDPNGNLIVAGTALDGLTVGDEVVYAASSHGGPFIMALDPQGKLLWKRTFDANFSVLAGVDGAGNVYMAATRGQFAPAFDFGQGAFEGDLAIAKFSPQQKLMWSKGFSVFTSGHEGVTAPLAFAVSPQGDVAVMGTAIKPVDFGGGLPSGSADAGTGLNGRSDMNLFLAVFDGAGHYRFDESWSPGGTAPSVAFDAQGNVLIAGTLTDSLHPNQSAFAAKFDTTGTQLWQQVFGDYSDARAITVRAGSVAFAGTFTGNGALGSETATARGLGDVFVAGLDSQGNPGYVTTFPVGTDGMFNALASDPSGGTVAFGHVFNYVDVGGGPLGPVGLLLAKFDAQGKRVSSALWPAPLGANAAAVAVDSHEHVFTFGTYEGAVDLGTGLLTHPRTFEQTLFVAKYAQEASPTGAHAACPVIDPAPHRDQGEKVIASGMTLYGTPTSLFIRGDELYWTTQQEVFRAAIGGSEPELLAFAQSGCDDLTADDQALYWANAGATTWQGPGALGAVMKLPLAGGSPSPLVDHLPFPVNLALAGTSAYFTSGGWSNESPATAALGVVSSSGGTTASLATGLGLPSALAAFGTNVVFAARDPASPSNTQLVRLGSGSERTVLATTDRAISSIVLDDTHAYWLESDSQTVDVSNDDGRVVSEALAGGGSTLLVSRAAGPHSLVRIGDQLLWANAGGFSNVTPTGNAGILSLPIAGGTPSSLISGRNSVGPFAADATHLAWVEQSGSDSAWVLVVRKR